jgi:DNA polymerase I
MQANGAEMLRLACCLATERGVEVCAPVHDALLVEGDVGQMGDVLETTRAAMTEASRVVLGGFEVGTDADVVEWPNRYADPRGAVIWERVTEILDRDQEGQTGHEGRGGEEG